MIRLSPPIAGGHVMSGWGRPRAYRGGVHEGLDFDARVGTPVMAAADGEVMRVDNKNNSFAGKWIAISHGGVITRYMHNSKNLVRKGDMVKRGQKIALVGRTGTKGKGKAHLHFDVKMLPESFDEFVTAYGKPPGQKTKRGSSSAKGVPAETLMDGAVYERGAKRKAIATGVIFYGGNSQIPPKISALFDGISAWLRSFVR